MDLPTIASSLINNTFEKSQSELGILDKCWRSGDTCTANVLIDGHVIFNLESKSKLQYTASYKKIGMIYVLQPGKTVLSL